MGIGTLTQRIVLFSVLLGVLLYGQSAFAQDTPNQPNAEFTKIEGDDIQTNPTAQKLLDRIEESKRILKEMMEEQPIITDHQKFIEEQRQLVEQNLQVELDRINKKYEDYSPRNAFAKFVEKFNESHQGIYWNQFEYMESKIDLARAAKQEVLDNGGTFQEAQREYIKYAAMPRGELIHTIIELNIKYGFANENTQKYFDVDGKLPRYEDDTQSKCYACNEFEKLRDDMLDPELNPYAKGTSTSQPTITTIVLGGYESTNLTTDDIQSKIDTLHDKIQSLGKQVAEEDDFEKQKLLLDSITKIAQEIETLQTKI